MPYRKTTAAQPQLEKTIVTFSQSTSKSLKKYLHAFKNCLKKTNLTNYYTKLGAKQLITVGQNLINFCQKGPFLEKMDIQKLKYEKNASH